MTASEETVQRAPALLETSDDIQRWLENTSRAERSRRVAALSKSQLAAFALLLSARSGPEVLRSVDADLAGKVLRAGAARHSARLLEAMDLDDAAEILRRMKEAQRSPLLDAVSPDYAQAVREMLDWPAESTAAHMIPDAFTVESEMTIAEAETAIRTQALRIRGKDRIGGLIYVTDADRCLVGVVETQDLILAQPDQHISDLMDQDLAWVSALVDAEESAQALADYDLPALPVVNEQRRLLGVLTADAAADILEEETTEDAERQGGSAPLEVPYLRAKPWLLWRKRIVWLLVLFVAEAYTGTVLRAFEDELEAVVALAFFIPLLIGTGGNTGTQITTTLVRAMATGQVTFRDMPRVLVKELSTGALIAVTMAAAAVVRSWTLGVGPEVTITVSLTVGAIVLWSAFVASILPPVLKKLKVDPAVVSAPMISTIVDGTGLIIYFMIAHATLSQLNGL